MRNEHRKSTKLDGVLYDVRGPVVDEARRMREAGETIIQLNIGNPAPFGFEAPTLMTDELIRRLPTSHGYSESHGLVDAREAIQTYALRAGIVGVELDDIYTGNGVSELITLCMQALLDTGDEMLIPMPDYPLWTATAKLAGGTPVHYLCDETNHWWPDLDDIKRKITPRTVGIVVINPNNPTGAVYPREILEGIVELAREHNLIIFADEIYDRMTFDGVEHTYLASLAPDVLCVSFSGLSKTHRVAGYRSGWMIISGNKALAGGRRGYIEGINMLSNMRLCANVPGQSVIAIALDGHQSVDDLIAPGGRIYEQRATMLDIIEGIEGLSVVKPEAALYVFPKLDVARFNITDDERFALDLLRAEQVLVVHGRGFNWHRPDHFRIVYLPQEAELVEVGERLARFLSRYRQ
ncbi:MAG: pyridoxal phosphate-dependent aminotransferase [Coriobacteriia bacterium]|nr:pyridoxal phosphate-dependent aminotransferase [Coriobacteriia bacterium]